MSRPETVIRLTRRITSAEASSLVGTPVGADLDPTVASPPNGSLVRLLDDETGETVALITRLTPARRQALRAVVLGLKYGVNSARHSSTMLLNSLTFGYATAKPMARQEGCRMTAIGRDNPTAEAELETLADYLAGEFDELMFDRAAADAATLSTSVLSDWRLGEKSLWTSGVINSASVLPYHRDGNNLPTWSAMPTLRHKMAGGHLHLPEYDLVFPTGDGDVTWFYGRGLVHGVTPMRQEIPGAYRYSVVFYALKGMVNCATYAVETKLVAARRSSRERAEAERVRAQLNLPELIEHLPFVADIPTTTGTPGAESPQILSLPENATS